MSLASGRTAHVRARSLWCLALTLCTSLSPSVVLCYMDAPALPGIVSAICSTELVGHIQTPGGESFRRCRRTGIASPLVAGGLVRHFGGAALESRSLFTAETIGYARKPAYSPPGDISVDCAPVRNQVKDPILS